MIVLQFQFASDIIVVRLQGNDIQLGSTAQGARLAPIDGLKLNYSGVIREFPDLKDRTDWREEAIKRFKEKIKSIPTEHLKAHYIIEDLRKFGYIPKTMQESGKRMEAIH